MTTTNIKNQLKTTESFNGDEWGPAYSQPPDYFKDHFFYREVGLLPFETNNIIVWKCTFWSESCGAIYDDLEKLGWGYDGYSDSMLPYCPKCGHRVYVVVDTGGKYDY